MSTPTKTFSDYGIKLGSKSGIEVKVTCPQCSAGRKKKNYPCLNVNTDKGLWNCWHCGWSGTLKGGEWQRPEIRKAYRRPTYTPTEQVPDGTIAWFATRGIGADVVKRNGIGKGREYFPQVEEERDCILFPYYRGDEVVNVKYRTKDKLFRMAAGAERVLYGLNDIHPELLIWVEGEIDKLSVEVIGFTSCVSVPDGAPAPDSRDYAHKFDYLLDPALDDVKMHLIAVDNDAAGVRLKEELIRRLGPEKCLVATWPQDCKDANEVLLKHGAEVLTECLDAARPPRIEGTYSIDDIRQAMRDRFEHGAPRGITTGWRTLDGHYRVMPGEITLITGIPGAGKSEWLDALTINLARDHGWRTLKTPGSTRKIPLTDRARDCLRDAVSRSSDPVLLYPHYTTMDGCNADTVSATLVKWVRNREGLKGTKLGNHSLRHGIKDLLRAVKCPAEAADQIIGHVTPGMGANYGEGYPLEMLYDWIVQANAQKAR